MWTVLQRATAALAMLVAAGAASAQATPDRLYHGINRPIPFSVEAPDDAESIVLELYDGTGTQRVARAGVEAGAIDLFEVFPILWNRTLPQPFYLQTVIDGEQVGSPIFLEPLRPPRQSRINPRTNGIEWAPDDRRRPYSGLRTYPAKFVEFTTSHGVFTAKLRPDQAPVTAKHILDLVEGGFYTDIVIHRILPTNANGDPFVIQFGDPRGYGLGGPGFFVDLEPSQLRHDFGVVSMARQSDNADSNGSQVFVCLSRAATTHLDDNYTSFAEVIDGAETLVAIQNVELDDPSRGVPAEPKPVVESARSIEAPPIGQWPERVTRPEPSQEQPR